MNTLNLELKKVRIHQGLSHETLAYTATLYVNGRAAFEVENDGQGGADMQYEVKSGSALTLKQINDWCKANLAPLIFDDFPEIRGKIKEPIPRDIEVWCHEEAERQDFHKSIKSKLARSILVKDGADIWQWSKKKRGTDRTEAILAHVAEKYPDAIVLNKAPWHVTVSAFAESRG
tara:strand:+ start:471 stop:995 length:525 start_codon:yes stop_codon:yes gene_type:complete